MGIRITRAANEQLGFRHPGDTDWNHISFCQIAEQLRRQGDAWTGRNAVVIRPGKIDRSPTGTGCSARLAVLHARGQIALGESYVAGSLLGSEFHCRVVDETTLAGRPAIIPEISGRAWITGLRTELLDPDDPWPDGYRLSDSWPRLDEA